MPVGIKDDGKPKDSSTTAVFKDNTQSRTQQLYGEVIPELLRKVGDTKSGRLAAFMVEEYLDRNVLIFDRPLLKRLFEEADFRQEGSLNDRALAAALSGRYPKRTLTIAWRQLVALLFDIPELILAEDVIVPKVANGTFNSENCWDEPPAHLPRVGRVGYKKCSSPEGEMQRMVAAAAAAVPHQGASPSLAPFGDSLDSFRASHSLKLGAEAGGASVADEEGALLLSSRGVQTVALTKEEMAVYSSMMSTGAPRSTFATVKEINNIANGLEVKSSTSAEVKGFLGSMGMGGYAFNQSMGGVGASTSGSATAGAGSMKQSMSGASTSGSAIAGPGSMKESMPGPGSAKQSMPGNGSMKQSMPSHGSMKQSMPGSGSTTRSTRGGGYGTAALASSSTSASALQTLRQSVRGSYASKPEFETMHSTLTVSDRDHKKTLGQRLDVTESLARVEPVRSTSIKFNADYITAGDYAPSCRTAPSHWDLHPTVPAEAKVACKYPWGNLG
eukprot:gene18773-25309_t